MHFIRDEKLFSNQGQQNVAVKNGCLQRFCESDLHLRRLNYHFFMSIFGVASKKKRGAIIESKKKEK